MRKTHAETGCVNSALAILQAVLQNVYIEFAQVLIACLFSLKFEKKMKRS